MVLILPHQLAASTMPSFAATSLKPLMINSLLMITITPHTGIGLSGIDTKHMSAVLTSSLSASGSINFPKFDTRLYFLAINPSSVSVSDAMIKIATAIYLEFPTTSVSIKNAKNGIIITLNIVILFGRFIL